MPVDSSTKDAVMDRAGRERNAVALGSLLRGLCRFRRVYYDDGKPQGKVLIAAHP